MLYRKVPLSKVLVLDRKFISDRVLTWGLEALLFLP
jgi:hypothetical protein